MTRCNGPGKGDCGWIFVGGAGLFTVCGADQGAPVAGSGPAASVQACDGFPMVCIGKMPLAECKAKCVADAACDAVTWNKGTTECFPKMLPTGCTELAKKPAGCPNNAGTPPISNWQYHIRCGPCGAALGPMPPGGGLVCPRGFGWTFVAVVFVAGGLYLLGGVAYSHQVQYSRQRDCHFTDIPSSSILKHLLKVEGGAAE